MATGWSGEVERAMDRSRPTAQLCAALSACTELNPVYRRLLKMVLEELQFLEQQIVKPEQEMASLLIQHQEAVQRLAEVPGLGVGSAQQIIAEVGAQAATFASQKHLSSWVGACPGDEESAGVSTSHRSPKGNRQMRRILNQCANAAVKTKGSIFEMVYRRLVLRLGHNQTIGAIAHRLCRLIWIILHRDVRYQERGPSVNARSRQRRTTRMIRELRSLGYRIEPVASPARARRIFDPAKRACSELIIGASVLMMSVGSEGRARNRQIRVRASLHRPLKNSF